MGNIERPTAAARRARHIESPGTSINDVPGLHLRRADSVLVQDIPD